jgi:hypothetical protein
MSESSSPAGTETTDAAPTTAADVTAGGSLLTGEQAATPATGTAQAEGAATEAEGTPASSEPAAQGAPETYADFVIPEGVKLDDTVAAEFKGLAKELNLSQENAQKVADVVAKQTLAAAQAQQAEIRSINDSWIAQTKADKEIGGEKLAENLAAARAAMEATTTPQLRMLLDRSGLGNNVEVIRHFLRIAPAFAEDTHVAGGKPPTGDKSAAKVLYPNNA